MTDSPENQLHISVIALYKAGQSNPERHRYVFNYEITIKNTGSVPAKLISRHWIITDANGNQQEVRGDGVIGEQPHIQPGESYCYTSGAILKTPVGSMYGYYHMVSDTGIRFEAPIKAFTLAVPGLLH